MPYEITEEFTEQKNLKENTPINLYRVTIPDVEIVRAAEWDTDIVYDAGDGEETFIALPLKRSDISRNIMGEIDSVKVTWCNINRQIGALLLNYGGLRGCQVDLITVFEDTLDDADANITETFWIDSSTIGETEATFTLTSKLDLFQVKIPCRIMNRDFCGWIFKQKGCWLTGEADYEEPPTFVNGGVECDHTIDGKTGCVYHGNKKRFGGFPAIPQRSIYVI